MRMSIHVSTRLSVHLFTHMSTHVPTHRSAIDFCKAIDTDGSGSGKKSFSPDHADGDRRGSIFRSPRGYFQIAEGQRPIFRSPRGYF